MAQDIRGAELDAGKQTLRSRIVEAVRVALKAAQWDPDDNDPEALPLFDYVDWGVLEDIDSRHTPGARIEEGDESLDPLFEQVSDKVLRLYVHFKIINTKGIDPTPMINYYFGRITQILVTPNHFADLAFDISEVGNSIQTQGPSDPEPGGTIYYDVSYRHRRGDPFTE